jgi:hypothetical protein
MFWKREEQPLDRDEVNDLMRFLIKMDAKLDEILAVLREEEDGSEEMDA